MWDRVGKTTPTTELADEISKYTLDPLGFVLFAFPWGEEGTELADKAGPREWQADILREIGEALRGGHVIDLQPILEAVASGHGIGKGHRIGHTLKIPIVSKSPNGKMEVTGMELKKWGTLKPGDYVFGPDGKPTKIIATRRYRQQHYRVSFDDGSSTVVSAEHEWAVRGRQERRKKVPEGDTAHTLSGWRILTTEEILALGVKRPNGKSLARQWEIPTTKPVEFAESELAVHPYFMGLWLGDGTRGQPTYTKPYPEIRERVEEVCGYAIHTAADRTQQRAQKITKKLTDPVFQCYGHERYIPEQYKYASVEQRMELFRGLMDSDGEVHKSGSIGFSSSSKQLAEDVIWLARSLGCKAKMQPAVKQPFYRDADGDKVAGRPAYRVTINAPFNPFTLKHRREAYKPSEKRYITRWIDSIEPVDEEEGMCIQVEHPTHLYLANDFIVTHNSALVAWIILWAMSTAVDTKGVVTANTEQQLKTKTWAELAKWYRLCITSHWFTLTATAIFAADPTREKTWRVDMVPWSERNTEAFAGLHNEGKRILLIFDEASAIPDAIWEVAEGALTDKDTEIIWAAFGNPTRNTGRFRECFGRLKHRWRTRHIDSRTVPGTNTKQFEQWVEDYGEDSDFVRVRVRGLFPRAGSNQFISTEIVEKAVKREAELDKSAPVIVGVDVARFGDDKSVIYTRVGRDGRQFKPLTFRGLDTMQLAAHVAEHCNRIRMAIGRKPDAIFIDGGGVGGGVVDRLRHLGFDVIEVQFGARASDERRYANKRAEMWGRMREWLEVGCIPDDRDLIDGLTAVEYGFTPKSQILLEKKEDMKKRGLASPDDADALALTFAEPVEMRDVSYTSAYQPAQGAHANARRSYDPYSGRR